MLAAEELLTREGVTLLLDTRCVAPVMEDGRCRGVITEGIEGDADVLLAALDTQGVLLVQEKGEGGRLLYIPAVAPDKVRW